MVTRSAASSQSRAFIPKPVAREASEDPGRANSSDRMTDLSSGEPGGLRYISQVHASLYKRPAENIPVKNEMPETNQEKVTKTLGRELDSFFALCIFSLVFGALALAFGIQFIVTSVLAMAEAGVLGILPFLQALVGWAAAVVGLRWIISTAGVLDGIDDIRTEYRSMQATEADRAGKETLTSGLQVSGKGMATGETGQEPVAGETLTGLILRMMAHYRENWKTIWRMNLISTLGGCIFLALGGLNLIQGVSVWPPSGLAILAAGIELAVGLASLLISSMFRRYAKTWELRLIEAEHSEEILRKSMEPG